MKSYFDEDNLAYSKRATKISNKINHFLNKLYKQELGRGYNIRELAHIISATIGIVASEVILRWQLSQHRGPK